MWGRVELKGVCVCVLNQKWRYNGSDRMTDLVPRSNKGDSSLCRFITAFLSEKQDGGWKGSSLSRISYASFESPSLSLFNFMALRVLYCLYPLSSSFFKIFLSFCVIFRPIFALTVVLFFFSFVFFTLAPPLQGFRQQMFPLSVSHSSLYYSDKPFNSFYVWDWLGQING